MRYVVGFCVPRLGSGWRIVNIEQDGARLY
jgi:hypothetical protein